MIRRNIRHPRARLQLIAAVCCVATLLFALPATASVQEIRVIAAGVDERSITADDKAMDYAKKRAVYLAAQKLNITDASKKVAKFSDDQFAEIIRGISVGQTVRRGKTTLTEVTVTIVNEALARALKMPDKRVDPESNTIMRGVMVLPMYVGHEHPYLWEKDNELRAPLYEEVRRQSHGGVLLPGGDLQDLRLIDYQNALTVKPEEMKPMFERYGAEEIIIAVLTPSPMGTTTPANVVLRRLRSDNTVRNETFDVPPADATEPPASRLKNAAVAIASAVTQIASSTSERELTQRAKAKQIKVRFNYAIPKDLANMQEAVRNAPEVLYLDLPSIALARIAGTIYLKGDEEALRQTLKKQGIIITTSDEGWALSTR